MRWLDFRRFRDLLCLIAQHDGELRAKDLNSLAVSNRILVHENGQPFRPTPVYHYRRALERLGLVRIEHRHYRVNWDEPIVARLVADAHAGTPLTVSERAAFGTLVLRNCDCYDLFLHAFVSTQRATSTVWEFIANSEAVALHIGMTEAGEHSVTLQNLSTGIETAYAGETAAQAILWGLKPWCVDQLQFVDELLTMRLEYVLYPRMIETIMPNSAVAKQIVSLLRFREGWAVERVEDLILRAGRKWRLPVNMTHKALLWLAREFPGVVATITTSERFVHQLHPSQRDAAVKSYLRLSGGGYVSHMRFHESLIDWLDRGGSGEWSGNTALNSSD